MSVIGLKQKQKHKKLIVLTSNGLSEKLDQRRSENGFDVGKSLKNTQKYLKRVHFPPLFFSINTQSEQIECFPNHIFYLFSIFDYGYLLRAT